MALSRFTTYIGLALDLVNAQLSAPVGIGATSLPLTNINDFANVLGTTGVSYSAIIIDGTSTETKTLLGELSGGAIAVTALTSEHAEFTYVVFQPTASIGPSAYLPLETYKPSDMYEQLYDDAVIGSRVPNRGAVAGVRTATVDVGGAFFADTFPYFLGAVLGSEDYTSGTASLAVSAMSASGGVVTCTTTTNTGILATGQVVTFSGITGSFIGLNGCSFVITVTSSTQFTIVAPYSAGTIGGSPVIYSPATHAFSVNNNSVQSAQNVYVQQSPRLLVYNYDAYNTRIFAGRFTDLTLTADPKALLKFSAKYMSRASGVVANPTKNFTAIVPLPSWTGYATIGGTDIGKVLTAEFTWAQSETESIPVLSGKQDPWDIWGGTVGTVGKFALIFDDDTQQNNYYNESQPAVTFKFIRTNSTGNVTQDIVIQMTQCNYEKADIVQQGKSYVTNEIEFQGLGNSTDATVAGGGISTCKVLVGNAVASSTTYT